MSKSTNRKYIQLYHDSLLILDKLTDEQAGILIKAIYQYSQNNEKPILDFALDIAITPFINQIDREQERNLQNADIYRENGKKGGRPKKNQNNQSGFLETKDNQNNQLKPITTTITNTITTNNTNTKTTKVVSVRDFDLVDFTEDEIIAIENWVNFRTKEYKLKKSEHSIKVIINHMKEVKHHHDIVKVVDYFINNTTMENIHMKNIKHALDMRNAANAD